uniref:Uncharacterized protein 90C4.240 n=1 Tax=Neurospora crassa TaxID=5141 RepID=Q6MGI8_NEUCS|nr:hypothetical protein [Neurospora crassa]
MYEAGILALMGWWYHGWKGDPNARVDLIFPCFFPLGVAVLVNAYEIVSFSCLDRRRPINVIAVCFDVLICAGSTFCFLLLGLIDNDPVQDRLRTDSTRERWRRDQSKAMIFMIVFCFLHALFIIMASVGCVYSGILKNRARRRRRIARNRAQMARFADERRRQMDVDKAQVGAPVEDVGQSEARSAELNSRGTESTQSTELEGNERRTRERLSVFFSYPPPPPPPPPQQQQQGASCRKGFGSLLKGPSILSKYCEAHAMTGIRPGEDATPDTPLHPYPLQEWRVPWSHRNMFSRIKKLSAEADEHGGTSSLDPGLPTERGYMYLSAGLLDPMASKLSRGVEHSSTINSSPTLHALRKERKISGEAGDNKKRKKHNGETVEEKAERKKQKKSQLGSWSDANFCTSPAEPAPDPNETEEQRKRRLRKEEEEKKEKKGEEGEVCQN